MTRITTTARVAFMHLPKTGGTSVMAALRKHLPADSIQTVASGVAEDPDNLDLDALRTKTLLHGHFSARWVGLFDRNTEIAVCLRDPRQAARSFYKYLLAHRPGDLTGRQAEIREHAELGFRSYLEYWRDERSSQYYVHFLDPLFMPPGATDTMPLSGAALDKAVDRALHFLDRCGIVGTSDDLTAFVSGILTALDRDTTGISVDKESISASLGRQDPARFTEIAPGTGDEDDEQTRQLLLDVSAPAMRIYQHALSLVGARNTLSGEGFGTRVAAVDPGVGLDFIVCGMPRGGTTFFGQLFNAHRDAYCYFMETGLFRQLSVFGRDRPFPVENLSSLEAYLRNEFMAVLVESTTDERTSKFRRLASYKRILGEYGLAETSGPGVRVWDEVSVQDFITAVVDLFRQGLYGVDLFRAGASLLATHLRHATSRLLVGEKTPDNLLFADLLWQAAPALKVFCILREPYSTLESMKRRALRSEACDTAFSREVWGGIAEYYRSLRAAYDLSQEAGSERFGIFRFEDLLKDPVAEMTRAYRMLDLDLTDAAGQALPQLCAPTDARHARTLELSVTECKLIEMTLGPMLLHFGYEVPAVDPIQDGTGFEEAVLVLGGVYTDADNSGCIDGKWMSGQADLFLLFGKKRTKLSIRLACNFPPALGLEDVTLTVSSGIHELTCVHALPTQRGIMVEIALDQVDLIEANATMSAAHLRIVSSAAFVPITIPGQGPDIREISFLIQSCKYA